MTRALPLLLILVVLAFVIFGRPGRYVVPGGDEGPSAYVLMADSAFAAGTEPALAIAQADPRTEADWPRMTLELTVTNGTPRHLLLEQGDRVTLAQPDSSYTLPAGAIHHPRSEGVR